MERREAIRKGIGGLGLTLIKPAHIPGDQHSIRLSPGLSAPPRLRTLPPFRRSGNLRWPSRT
jgi:hypothetical protein